MSEAFLANHHAPEKLRNKIFICDGFGKKYKTIDLERLLQSIQKTTRWVLLEFDAEEDLILIDNQGIILIVDILDSSVLGVNTIKLPLGSFKEPQN